jgi:hypothetical protein
MTKKQALQNLKAAIFEDRKTRRIGKIKVAFLEYENYGSLWSKLVNFSKTGGKT